jgi:hypothetical protein
LYTSTDKLIAELVFSLAPRITSGLADQPLSEVTAPAKVSKVAYYQTVGFAVVGALLQLRWSYTGKQLSLSSFLWSLADSASLSGIASILGRLTRKTSAEQRLTGFVICRQDRFRTPRASVHSRRNKLLPPGLQAPVFRLCRRPTTNVGSSLRVDHSGTRSMSVYNNEIIVRCNNIRASSPVTSHDLPQTISGMPNPKRESYL